MGGILGLSWLQDGSKKPQDEFWQKCGPDLDAKLEPNWGQIEAKLEPSWSQEASREAPGMIFEGSRHKLNIEGSWDRFFIDF